jgi:hypothetical protein
MKKGGSIILAAALITMLFITSAWAWAQVTFINHDDEAVCFEVDDQNSPDYQITPWVQPNLTWTIQIRPGVHVFTAYESDRHGGRKAIRQSSAIDIPDGAHKAWTITAHYR